MSDPTTADAGGLSPAAFHRSPDVAEWRVTGTGPQAVFTATSLAHAAALVAPVVAEAERAGIQVDVDLRPEAVIVRIPYRGPDGIAAAAPEFAAAVSQAAAELELTPDPERTQSIGIYVAQHSAADVRPFFTAALGYEEFGETDAVDPLRCGPQLAFNPSRVTRRRGAGPTSTCSCPPTGRGCEWMPRSRPEGGSSTTHTHPPGGRWRRPTTTASTSLPGPTPSTEAR